MVTEVLRRAALCQRRDPHGLSVRPPGSASREHHLGGIGSTVPERRRYWERRHLAGVEGASSTLRRQDASAPGRFPNLLGVQRVCGARKYERQGMVVRAAGLEAGDTAGLEPCATRRPVATVPALRLGPCDRRCGSLGTASPTILILPGRTGSHSPFTARARPALLAPRSRPPALTLVAFCGGLWDKGGST